MTMTTPANDKVLTPISHVYQFCIEIEHGAYNDDGTYTVEEEEFTTIFVSRYISRDTADIEALEAAKLWGHNIHRTCGDTKASPDWRVHVRQGVGVTWYSDNDKLVLAKPEYRAVGIVKL